MDQEQEIMLMRQNMPTAGELLTLKLALASVDAGREVNPTFSTDLHSLVAKMTRLRAADSKW